MPKHTRCASSSQSYGNSIPVSLAPSPMYGQPRMSMSNSYYTLPSSSSASMSLQPQQQQQQPSYESYAATMVQPTLTNSPPVQHRASSGAWTPQDDQQLLQTRMQGLNWGQIQANYFPNKTPNACRKRHERLMERKGADDWDNQKLQRLAKEYMSMRKEIWQGLAARTGEKWNVVEQKCMSNGLKNLQSAARAAARRDRLEAGGQLSGYDDDSGISGMGLTPVDELDASYSSPETSSSSSSHHSIHSHPATAAAYQHLQPHHHMATLGGGHQGAGYGLSPYGSYPSHGYSSSTSSNARAGHGYHPGNSQSSSPYMNGQRQPSADMGIGAIINRPGGGGV